MNKKQGWKKPDDSKGTTIFFVAPFFFTAFYLTPFF
jgi:hypothetical protein